MPVRKARVADVPAIHALVNHYARQEIMLPLSLSDVYDRLRDFFVCEEQGEVVACGALHVVWEDLAEVRSVAVRQDRRGHGIGRALVEACLREAPGLGVRRVFTLTFEAGFFAVLGMVQTSKDTLPHKVWADCIRCPHFPNCDEVALSAALRPDGTLAPPGQQREEAPPGQP